MNEPLKQPAPVDNAMTAYMVTNLGTFLSEAMIYETGFIAGIFMALSRPEWAQGFAAESHHPRMDDVLLDEICAAVPVGGSAAE